MSTTELPRVWTVAQAVEHLGGAYSASTLRRQIKLGNLKAKRTGRCVRILDEELARWLRDYSEESAA